jgi:nicotinamidase-related amidase
MDKALILVDFEKGWIDKNSDYFVGDISGTIKRTNKLRSPERDAHIN